MSRTSAISPIVALLSATAAFADGSWEVMMIADGAATVPGVDGAIWVPNQFNNPTIDSLGRVTFRGQMAGAGISTANSRVIMQGLSGAWSILAREGSPLPGDLIPGAVINTATGINGLSSANNISVDGGTMVSGSANGGGVVAANNDFNIFVANDGTKTMIAREGTELPGNPGVLMTVPQFGSGTNVSNDGSAFVAVTLSGTGVVTAAGATQNNAASMVFGPSGAQVVIRRGDAAPGAGAGDQWNVPAGAVFNQDTFGHFKNGSLLALSGKLLHPVTGTIPLSADNVYLTNAGAPAGQLRIIARDGSAVPGFPSLTFLQVSDFSGPLSWSGHPITNDGKILFSTRLGGAVTAGLDDYALMVDDAGSLTMKIRRGDSFPGLAAGQVWSTANVNSMLISNTGQIACQGIAMNADGSAATDGTFVCVIKADGSKHMICRQGDQVAGLPEGVVYGSLNGSTSLCQTDSGIVVFTANITGAPFPAGAAAIMAWDSANGLRILAKTGDTNFTGTAYNQGTLIGGTGNNGNGGHTGINANGMLVARFGDSVNAKYAIARIQLDATSSACPADIDGSGAVDGADLGALLSSWGAPGDADLDQNGTVDGADLGMLLSAWGQCAS